MSKLLHKGFQIVSETEMMRVAGGVCSASHRDGYFGRPELEAKPKPEPRKKDPHPIRCGWPEERFDPGFLWMGGGDPSAMFNLMR